MIINEIIAILAIPVIPVTIGLSSLNNTDGSTTPKRRLNTTANAFDKSRDETSPQPLRIITTSKIGSTRNINDFA